MTKDTLIAEKDKQIAIASQKDAQNIERITQLEANLTKGKAEINSLLKQLNSQNEESESAAKNEQRVLMLDALEKSHTEEKESMLQMHEEEKKALVEELSQLKTSSEQESLSTKA